MLAPGTNRYEVNLEDLCTCFGLDHGIKQLRNIKINQPYMEGHTPAHMPAAWQRLKAKRGGLFFIIGKGAKSCWYVGDYINANCIGEPLVLKKGLYVNAL